MTKKFYKVRVREAGNQVRAIFVSAHSVAEAVSIARPAGSPATIASITEVTR